MQALEAIERAMTPLLKKGLELSQSSGFYPAISWCPQRLKVRFVSHAAFSAARWLAAELGHSDQSRFQDLHGSGEPKIGSFDALCCIFTLITLGHTRRDVNSVAERASIDGGTQL